MSVARINKILRVSNSFSLPVHFVCDQSSYTSPASNVHLLNYLYRAHVVHAAWSAHQSDSSIIVTRHKECNLLTQFNNYHWIVKCKAPPN